VRTADDLPEPIRTLVVDGRDAWRARDYVRARRLFEEALRRSREGGERFGVVTACHFLGNLAFNECRDVEARTLHAAALELSEEVGDDQGIATSLGSLALCDVAAGDLDAAERRFAGAVEAYLRAGMPERAGRVRETADGLLVRRVPLDELVHRSRAPAGPSTPLGAPTYRRRRPKSSC
jgi:hypothetical protein